MSEISGSTIANDIQENIDYELLEKLNRPFSTTGGYARSIAIAYKEFSNKVTDIRIENYIVNISISGDCYIVEFFSPSNKVGTSTPHQYCVQKDSYEIKYLSSDYKPKKSENR